MKMILGEKLGDGRIADKYAAKIPFDVEVPAGGNVDFVYEVEYSFRSLGLAIDDDDAQHFSIGDVFVGGVSQRPGGLTLRLSAMVWSRTRRRRVLWDTAPKGMKLGIEFWNESGETRRIRGEIVGEALMALSSTPSNAA